MDMLRFHKFTIGWNWIADYGSSDNPDEFKALYAYSPLHNIKAGAKYPATLITTADHDDRVVPAHSFKYAATLQEKASKDTPILIRIDTNSGHGASSLTKALETTGRHLRLHHAQHGAEASRQPRLDIGRRTRPVRLRRIHPAPGLAVAAILAAAVVAATAWDEKLALVTVVAEQSKPASALTPADFSLSEEKDKVQVIEAVPAKDPLSVVLLVDTALPQDGSALTPELRRAVKSFVATLLAGEPAARIALYQVSNAALPLLDFSSDRVALDTAIDLIASGTSAGSAMLEGVVTAAKRVGDRPAPRRAIVAVGIGTAEGTSLNPKIVGDTVRKSGATLWVVSVQGLRDASLTNRDTVWTRATEDTGGLRQNAVQATRLDVPLQTVANSLLSQYFLKMTRTRDGAVKGLKGTAGGAQVLFTRWMR